MVPSALQSPPSGRGRGRAQILWIVPVARLIFRSSPPAKKPTDWPSGDQKGSWTRSVPASTRAVGRTRGARPQHRGLVLGLVVVRSGLWNGPEHDLAAVGRHDRPAPEVEAPTVGRIDHEPARGRLLRRRLSHVGDRERGRVPSQDSARRRPRPIAPSFFPGAPLRPRARTRRPPLLPGPHSRRARPAARAGPLRCRGAACAGPCAGTGPADAGSRGASPSAARRGRAPSSPPPRSRPSPCPRRRAAARQHLVEHDAEGPDVRTPVDRLAARLLGRHVGGRARGSPRPSVPVWASVGAARGPRSPTSLRSFARPVPWRARSRGP